MTALAVWQRRRRPYLIVGWLWYVVTLLPVIGLVQAGDQALADRFTYVPLIGPSIMTVWLAREAAASHRWLRPALGAIAAAVLVAFGVRAWQQTRTWRDGVTLFEQALSVTPDNPVARHNLGRALALSNRIDEAVDNYEAALALDPNRVTTRIALGAALQRRGRLDDARAQYEAALRIDPASSEAHNNLGLVLAIGDREDARSHYLEAIRLDPENTDAMVNLATLLYDEGRRDAAVAMLERALAIDPFDENARYNLRQLRARR